MKMRNNPLAILRRLMAVVSLFAMTAIFFVPAAARWCGWLPRLQLVPALMAGAVLDLVALVASVLLFGRVYCSVLCPLGIVQDVFRFLFHWVPQPKAHPACFCTQALRVLILVLFVICVLIGLTGLIEPYGIFGRFVTVGIRRLGEPAVVTVVWVCGLMAFILAMTYVRARWWCNRICPVGTFLGLFSRFALFRVRINKAKCAKCGLCVKRCDKGALAVRADRSVALDASSCVVCGNCLGSCAKGALRFSPVRRG